jgi:hypothetical protein
MKPSQLKRAISRNQLQNKEIIELKKRKLRKPMLHLYFKVRNLKRYPLKEMDSIKRKICQKQPSQLRSNARISRKKR